MSRRRRRCRRALPWQDRRIATRHSHRRLGSPSTGPVVGIATAEAPTLDRFKTAAVDEYGIINRGESEALVSRSTVAKCTSATKHRDGGREQALEIVAACTVRIDGLHVDLVARSKEPFQFRQSTGIFDKAFGQLLTALRSASIEFARSSRNSWPLPEIKLSFAALLGLVCRSHHRLRCQRTPLQPGAKAALRSMSACVSSFGIAFLRPSGAPDGPFDGSHAKLILQRALGISEDITIDGRINGFVRSPWRGLYSHWQRFAAHQPHVGIGTSASLLQKQNPQQSPAGGSVISAKLRSEVALSAEQRGDRCSGPSAHTSRVAS